MSKDIINSVLFNTDSYKVSQWLQDPENLTSGSGYIEARKSWKDYNINDVVFMGLQPLLLNTPLKITQHEVDVAAKLYKSHGMSFNVDGFTRIVREFDGNFPIQIDALPEGTVVSPGVPMVRISETHPDFVWLVRFVETLLLRAIWYMSTVASLSRAVRKHFEKYFEITSDEKVLDTTQLSSIDFKLHDFGFRGVSSHESGVLGGIAHMVSFKGSDTAAALVGAMEYYDSEMPAFSIDASEHSTVTIRGRDGEEEFIRQHLKVSGNNTKMLATVVDSYNVFDVVDNVIGGTLKQEIIDSGKVLVVRPDSGNPTEMVSYVLNSLWNSFGGTINSKGFKVLHPSVRVLQGDGVNHNSINEILEMMVSEKFSIDNVAFGMGGKLLQGVSRDDFGFANKLSYAKVNGLDVDVYKDPITDKGKTSKKGIVYVELVNGKYVYTSKKPKNDQLITVYKNGNLLKKYTFDEVKKQSVGNY